MSLLGRIKNRLSGKSDGQAISLPYLRPEQELPFLHEQIRAYSSVVPIRASRGIQNYSGETAEMRMGYRRALLAEPAIKAALLGKIAAVMSLGLNVKVYDDTPFDQRVASFVKHSLTTVKGGLPALIEKILVHGLMDGFTVCEKVWKQEDRGRWQGKIGLSTLKAKDSRYVDFYIDRYRNIIGVVSMQNNAGITYEPSDFVIFSYLSLFENPFGASDLRASYRAAEMIPALIKLRMIFLDKYAGPFMKARTNDTSLIPKMQAELAQARQGGFIVLTPDMDVEVMNLATTGTSEFLDALEDLRKEIATGISGAFLHMMTGDGGVGARGDSGVQQDTADLFVWMLAVKVAAVFNEQLVEDLVTPNFGADVGLPTVSLEAPNPEAIVAELAIDQMLHSMNVPLSLEELYERSGRRPPKDKADTLVAGPLPADFPGNEDTGENFDPNAVPQETLEEGDD